MPKSENEVRIAVASLQKTAQALGDAAREPEVIQALLQQVVSALSADRAKVGLLAPGADELLVSGSFPRKDEIGVPAIRLSGNPLYQRAVDGEVVAVPNVEGTEGAFQENGGALALAPLAVRGRSIGVLEARWTGSRQLHREERLLLETLADMGAIALEKARHQQSLYAIAQALNSSLEPQTMLRKLLEATVENLWLKAALIRILDPGTGLMKLMVAHGLSERYLTKGEIHLARSTIDQRALEGEVVVIYDVEQEPGFEYPRELSAEGIRSALAVPLKQKDRAVGVVRVYSAQPRQFGAVAVRFLSSVADLIALALENAELYGMLKSRYEDLKLDLAEWYRFLALG